MSLTYLDLLEKLEKLDEVSLLELLEITSDEIVFRFQDKIEERLDNLVYEFEQEEEVEDE